MRMTQLTLNRHQAISTSKFSETNKQLPTKYLGSKIA